MLLLELNFVEFVQMSLSEHKHPNAAHGREPLVMSLRLSAAANWER